MEFRGHRYPRISTPQQTLQSQQALSCNTLCGLSRFLQFWQGLQKEETSAAHATIRHTFLPTNTLKQYIPKLSKPRLKPNHADSPVIFSPSQRCASQIPPSGAILGTYWRSFNMSAKALQAPSRAIPYGQSRFRQFLQCSRLTFPHQRQQHFTHLTALIRHLRPGASGLVQSHSRWTVQIFSYLARVSGGGTETSITDIRPICAISVTPVPPAPHTLDPNTQAGSGAHTGINCIVGIVGIFGIVGIARIDCIVGIAGFAATGLSER